jgi:hypothetical protein
VRASKLAYGRRVHEKSTLAVLTIRRPGDHSSSILCPSTILLWLADRVRPLQAGRELVQDPLTARPLLQPAHDIRLDGVAYMAGWRSAGFAPTAAALTLVQAR